MPVLARPDPFAPVLLTSTPVVLSQEQRDYIKKILDIACSDSRFAEKAYVAILLALTGLPVVPPVISGLAPASAAIGDASFTLHVNGTGFTPDSVIIFAGVDEPTTFVSATELTTGVNMEVWVGPDALPVHVQNADGVISDPKTFTFTGPVVLSSTTVKPTSPFPLPTPSHPVPTKQQVIHDKK